MAESDTTSEIVQDGDSEIGGARVYRQWDENRMRVALQTALDRKHSGEELRLKELAGQWHVPVDTLRRRMKSGDYDNYKHKFVRGQSGGGGQHGRVLFQWDECNMKEALKICLDHQKIPYGRDKLSVKQVADNWCVPVSTLYKRVRSGFYGNYRHGGYVRMRNRELVDSADVGASDRGMFAHVC